MNNPSLESYYIFVFKYYAFDHFFDILKELLSSFQMCGNEFWDNKWFSRYKENCNRQNFE